MAFRIAAVSQKGLDNDRYCMQISMTRTGIVKYYKLPLDAVCKMESSLMIGDFLIEVCEKKWNGNNQMCRLNFHT